MSHDHLRTHFLCQMERAGYHVSRPSNGIVGDPWQVAEATTHPLERGPRAGEHVALLTDISLPESCKRLGCNDPKHIQRIREQDAKFLADNPKGLTSDWVFFE